MSSVVQDLLRRTNDPGYINWLNVGNAIMLLGDGLRKYAESKMKEFHALITKNVGGPGIQCNCKCTPGKKPNPHGRTKHCVWAQEIKSFHVFTRKSDIPWHQSNSSQWDDPNLGYWEIAKLFMSDLGKDCAKTKDPSTTDVGPLLNLLITCNHFNIKKRLLHRVKDWRNKCAHAPGRTLSDMERQAAFKDIENLMNDPELMTNKDVQDCRPAIKGVEKADVAILQDVELEILREYQRIKEFEDMTEKLAEVTKNLTEKIPQEISDKVTEKITEKVVDKITEKVADKVTEKITNKDTEENTKNVAEMVSFFLKILLFLISNVPARILLYLVAYLMFSQVGDKSVILDDGCPTAMIKSPIFQEFKKNFQEFDFSFHLALKREGFVGRKWFFLELESLFKESTGIAGVLVTGDPGSGKSALMSQLICSPYSSLLIHDNVIGYHLCEYSEPGKRDGARFVRNLVDQIAARLRGYAEHVMQNEQLQTELYERCHKDPTGCFFTTIIGPLRRMKQPDNFKFIVIDALDECFDGDKKASEILKILNSKIKDFPKWLKVILTSRNVTSVTSKLPRTIDRTILYAMDDRNVKDIRYYVLRFISQNSYFLDRLKTALPMPVIWRSRTESMKIFLDEVITQAEGNFLFVKTMLQYMNDTDGKLDLYSLPSSLFDLYDSFFDRQFEIGGSGPLRCLFEVLLAANSPFQSQDVEEILRIEHKDVDITKLIAQMSCFLRFGRDGTVRIYHQSFSDWLINQTRVPSINKSRGHQNIAKFLLRGIHERHETVTFEELTELFMHILSGKALEMQETELDLSNIAEIREPQTNQSILHYLVIKPSMYLPVLDFFSQKFQSVDVVDARNKTPAFYAASEGFVWSLQSCLENGANIDSFLEGYADLDSLSVVVQNKGIEEFSLMHAASAKGHTDVVELLINSNLSFPDSSKNYPSPLHLAAGNGHLEVVKLFYHYEAMFDQVTLHHAAARNHSAVVQFLLTTAGLRDTCIPCEPKNFTQLNLKKTIKEVHSYFCETALHAAVSRGLVNIVKVLLQFGKEALECKHHSGKTVLMDAVERNDTEMVDLLLEHGANVTNECGRSVSKDTRAQIFFTFSMYKNDFLYTLYSVNDSCDCGNRAVHVSAKYGLWKMAEKLISGRLDDLKDLVNCDQNDAIAIAVIYDRTDFVKSINISFNKINMRLVESVILKEAVKYCSANVAYLVRYEYDDIGELLQMSIYWSPCYEIKTKIVSHCLEAFKYSNFSEAEKIQKESERRLEIMKLLIETHQQSILHKKYDHGRTLLHYAAFYGIEDAVKYLVERGADPLLKDHDGNTPLMLALNRSPDNYLTPTGPNCMIATSDLQISLCNTTCYDETVRFLIQSQISSISKCDNESALMLQQVILKRMPSSLFTLLKAGVDLNCRLNYSAMYLNLAEGGREVGEVLKMFEVDVSLKCGVSYFYSELHIISHFSAPDLWADFFRPSLNKKRSPLQRLIDRHPRGVRILDECYDAEGFLPIHRAAQGGNIDAIKWFKNTGVNTQLKTRSDHLTALDISLWYLKGTHRSIQQTFYSGDARKKLGYRDACFEELFQAFFDTSEKNYSSHVSSTPFCNQCVLHLASEIGLDVFTDVYNKALEIVRSLKKNKFLILDEQNVNGQTPLHIAARKGHADVVKYLVRLGADFNIKDKNGSSPLLTALRFSTSFNQQCYTTDDGIFTSCKTKSQDETVRYLISLQKSSISKCDAQSAYMLNQVIKNLMPLSLYALLKAGVDVNCQEDESLRPFLQHLRKGGHNVSEVSEVLKIFEVDISVKCGVPFMFSELHLISYKLVSGDFGNFFKPSLNKKRFPLQRLIDRHPRGVRVLDECYDAEGFLPIHRAAQGGNIVAIKWFKSVGVNTQLKTRSGLTALDISMLYLGDVYYAQLVSSAKIYFYLHKSYWIVPVTTSENRIRVFEQLLLTLFNPMPANSSKFSCGPGLEGLSPLHLAAVKGMNVLRYVHKTASKLFPSLPINCSNKHRLDPVYVASFYDSVRNKGLIEKYSGENSSDVYLACNGYLIRNLDEEIVDRKKTDQGNIDQEFSRGSILAAQYPDREVDFLMAFNFLYRPPRVDTTEKVLLRTWGVRIRDCPGYFDNSPNLDEEAVPLENNYSPNYSECLNQYNYYWSLCIREVEENYVHTHVCPRIVRTLKSWITGKRRRNRQLTPFIVKRLGWSDSFRDTKHDDHWPFYFLHKVLMKEYEAYEYLKVLNEAFEIADIRFDSGSFNEFQKESIDSIDLNNCVMKTLEQLIPDDR